MRLYLAWSLLAYNRCPSDMYPPRTADMQEFREYLTRRRITSPTAVDFYLLWVRQCLRFRGKRPNDEIEQEDLDRFLKHQSRMRETWQVDQARHAIEIYRFWKNRATGRKSSLRKNGRTQWRAVIDEMHNMMRLRQLSLRTEQAYFSWVKRFYRHLKHKAPKTVDSTDVKHFMTYLAVERNVSAATQNQAFNAILFLFRHVLEKDIENIGEAIRARKKRRLPVVLTRDEVYQLFAQLSGTKLLMAKIIYGGGLRLQECLKLRVKDLDFDRNTIVVKSGKGDKDRETVMPQSIRIPIEAHLKSIRRLFDEDRKCNIAGVKLPGALERKLRKSGKEWGWFWVFPAKTLSMDPDAKVIRRHLVHSSGIQKKIKSAAQQAGIVKRVTVHTLRHSFATHLVEKGCDIRTVQELLGHNDLRTTMVYTHVASKNRLGIASPLD